VIPGPPPTRPPTAIGGNVVTETGALPYIIPRAGGPSLPAGGVVKMPLAKEEQS